MPTKLIGVSSQVRITALLVFLSAATVSPPAAPREAPVQLAGGPWGKIVKTQGSPHPRRTPSANQDQQQNQQQNQQQKPRNPFGPITK